MIRSAAKRMKQRSAGKPDIELGKRLRLRRVEQKISQAELSDKLGVSFQQIQKYEKGVNRMSAAMMVQIAAVLKVDVQYFFDELPTGAKNSKEIKTPILIDMSLAAHGPRLIGAFLKLKTDELRVRSPISRRKRSLLPRNECPKGPNELSRS